MAQFVRLEGFRLLLQPLVLVTHRVEDEGAWCLQGVVERGVCYPTVGQQIRENAVAIASASFRWCFIMSRSCSVSPAFFSSRLK